MKGWEANGTQEAGSPEPASSDIEGSLLPCCLASVSLAMKYLLSLSPPADGSYTVAKSGKAGPPLSKLREASSCLVPRNLA